MSILNRDVFNEYNVDYNPVGLRNISLPNSFFTSLNAYEFNPTDIQSRIDAAKNREALNKQGLMALDDAGFVTEPYETFAEKAKPGLNIDFANFGTFFHLLNVFLVSLPFKTIIGIFFLSKLKIVLGHISESIKKAAEGFQYSKNFSDNMFVSMGKN